MDGRPVSFTKLNMFIKEKRRNLRFFLDATTEVAAADVLLPEEDVDMDADGDVVEEGSGDDNDGPVMSPEENLALSDDEELFSDDDEDYDIE